MVFRWLLYLLALALSAWCQISYTGYLVHLIFFAVLLLPLLSLAVSLPAMLSLRLRLEAEVPTVLRGQPALFRCRVESRIGLPVSRFRIRLSWQQGPEERPRRLTLPGWGTAAVELAEELPPQRHCGLVTLTARRFLVWDALGLFVLRRPCPAGLEILVAPGRTEADPFRGWTPEGAPLPLRPVPGGVGEDYDLRTYRPGDQMGSVHWKLSSRQEELVVREPLARPEPTLLLLWDHFGSRAQLDLRLELLQKASLALLEEGRPHLIRWLEPNTGLLRSYAIHCRADWDRCLTAALRDPMCPAGISLRAGGQALAGLTGPVHTLWIDGEEGDSHG